MWQSALGTMPCCEMRQIIRLSIPTRFQLSRNDHHLRPDPDGREDFGAQRFGPYHQQGWIQERGRNTHCRNALGLHCFFVPAWDGSWIAADCGPLHSLMVNVGPKVRFVCVPI